MDIMRTSSQPIITKAVEPVSITYDVYVDETFVQTGRERQVSLISGKGPAQKERSAVHSYTSLYPSYLIRHYATLSQRLYLAG